MPEEKAPKAPKTPKAEKPVEKAEAPAPVEAKSEAKAEKKPEGKKVNKKVIIGAAAAVVAVGGGVAAVYAVNNTPENVAVSAITNFINSDALSVTGTIDIDASKSGIKELKIELKAKSDKEKQAETTASLKADLGFFKIDVSLGSVLVKDHTIYLKLDGLKDSINKEEKKRKEELGKLMVNGGRLMFQKSLIVSTLWQAAKKLKLRAPMLV